MVILHLSLNYEHCTKLTNILTNICNAKNNGFLGISVVAWWWPMRWKYVAAELLYVVNNTYIRRIDRLYMCNVTSNSNFFLAGISVICLFILQQITVI